MALFNKMSIVQFYGNCSLLDGEMRCVERLEASQSVGERVFIPYGKHRFYKARILQSNVSMEVTEQDTAAVRKSQRKDVLI